MLNNDANASSFFVLLFHTVNLMADEVRPAYLEVKEIKQNIFALILKVPAKGSKKLKHFKI